MLILQYKIAVPHSQHSATNPICKHQHERQYLDYSALRLSGQTTTYSYRCRLENIAIARRQHQFCSFRQQAAYGLMNMHSFYTLSLKLENCLHLAPQYKENPRLEIDQYMKCSNILNNN